MPYVLAHERHHSAWGYHYYYLRGGTRRDLLISLISEGMADAFAHELCPDLHPEWIEALSPDEEAGQWAAMQPLLDVPDPERARHRRFFSGAPEGGVPAYTGYTIGCHIVQAYQGAHPGERVADWTIADPQAVLDESGYMPGAARG